MRAIVHLVPKQQHVFCEYMSIYSVQAVHVYHVSWLLSIMILVSRARNMPNIFCSSWNNMMYWNDITLKNSIQIYPYYADPMKWYFICGPCASASRLEKSWQTIQVIMRATNEII